MPRVFFGLGRVEGGGRGRGGRGGGGYKSSASVSLTVRLAHWRKPQQSAVSGCSFRIHLHAKLFLMVLWLRVVYHKVEHLVSWLRGILE